MPDTDHPLEHIAEVEREEPAELSALERLRAFEDRHLGEDTPRFNGAVEKGHGSLFARPVEKGGKLTDAHRKAHAAIEKTCHTEDKLNAARGALAQAEADHAATVKAADEAEGRID